MKKCILNIILLGITFSSFSQNAVEDLKKVRNYFLEANQIGFEVEVYHYQTKDAQPKLLSKGIMRKSGKNYYSSFMSDKMIVNAKTGTLLIDEENQEMTFLENQKSDAKSNQIEIPDSLMESYKYIGKENSFKVYEYNDVDPLASIVKTKLFISDNNELKKIIYYYNKSTKKVSYDAYKVEIVYKNIIQKGINNSYFNLNKYLSFINNKPKLNKQYSHYKLLN